MLLSSSSGNESIFKYLDLNGWDVLKFTRVASFDVGVIYEFAHCDATQLTADQARAPTVPNWTESHGHAQFARQVDAFAVERILWKFLKFIRNFRWLQFWFSIFLPCTCVAGDHSAIWNESFQFYFRGMQKRWPFLWPWIAIYLRKRTVWHLWLGISLLEVQRACRMVLETERIWTVIFKIE